MLMIQGPAVPKGHTAQKGKGLATQPRSQRMNEASGGGGGVEGKGKRFR